MNCKKTRFANEEAAKFYLDKIKLNSDRNKIPIRAYKCECGAWHLTKRVRYEDIEMENLHLREMMVEMVDSIEKMKVEIKLLNRKESQQAKNNIAREPAYKLLREKINRQQKEIKSLRDIRNELFAQLQKFDKK